jgi:glycosyltransferase involved in cell wall biosynthesis
MAREERTAKTGGCRMKIAIITNSRIPSLTANSMQAMKMCDALTQLGNELSVFAPAETKPAAWEELARHYGLKNRFQINYLPSYRPFKRFDFVWYAHFAAKKFNADLFYTWLPQSAVFGLWGRAPVVLEMHANTAGHLGAWWVRQFWNVKGHKRLLVTTQALRKALERSTRIMFPDDAVLVAQNGVDHDRYQNLPNPAEARRQLNLKEGRTVGFTGHFYAGRGMNLLFDLARALSQVNFIWAGGTPEAVVEWRIKLDSVRAANVTLTGFIENSRLPLVQAAADILLMPYSNSISASSGQDIAEVINPMKMFEYMATGRAIITADLPVIREVLDETRAVFCPPDNLEAWKSAIEDLLTDDNRRTGLASSARNESEKYTWLSRAHHALRGME